MANFFEQFHNNPVDQKKDKGNFFEQFHPKAPEPDGPVLHALKATGQTIDDGVRAAANAITFGKADDIANLMNRVTGRHAATLSSLVTGNPDEHQLSKEAASRSPVATIAGTIAGSAIPAARIARGVGAVVPALSRMTLGSVAGNAAATGALMSAGSDFAGKGDVRDISPTKAATEGAMGGVTGGAFHLAAKAFSPLARLAAHGAYLTQAEKDATAGAMQSAAQSGVPLKIPEALAAVAPGRAGKIEGVYNSSTRSSEGSQAARNFDAARAPQIADAARRVGDAMGPESSGFEVQRAAQRGIDAAHEDLNNATRPDYRASVLDTARAPSTAAIRQARSHLLGNPIEIDDIRHELGMTTTEARAAVRGVGLARAPETPVFILDKVKKALDTSVSQNEESAPNTARLLARSARDLVSRMTDASPDYRRALRTQATVRSNLLDPLEAGPLGKVAGTADSGAQADALFNVKTPREAADAMDAASRMGHPAASRLLGNHIRRAVAEGPQSLSEALPNEHSMAVAQHIAGPAITGPILRTISALRAVKQGGRTPTNQTYGYTPHGVFFHHIMNMGKGKIVEALHDPRTLNIFGQQGIGQRAAIATGLGVENEVTRRAMKRSQ